jgi:transposase
MNKKRQYKTYPKVFKEEAVALVLEQGYSVTEAAQSLNIKDNLLYNWKKKLEEQSSGSMLNTQEKTELIQLRKENKRLKMEKEILKKASAFFAKEMK